VEASNPISNRRASHGRQGCQDGRAWPSWGGRCIKRGNRQSYSAASGRNLPSFSKNAKSATVFGGRPLAKRGQNATFHVRLQEFPVPSNLLERGKAVALLPRAFGAGGVADMGFNPRRDPSLHRLRKRMGVYGRAVPGDFFSRPRDFLSRPPPAQKTWQTGKLNFFSDATCTDARRYDKE
jgi:hypothetical protein